jgi:hypothetical protein
LATAERTRAFAAKNSLRWPKTSLTIQPHDKTKPLGIQRLANSTFETLLTKLSDSRAAVQQFIEGQKLPRLQGHAGARRNTELLQKLGISSVPEFLMIDPEGKLIDSLWSADVLNERLSAALNSKTQAQK